MKLARIWILTFNITRSDFVLNWISYIGKISLAPCCLQLMCNFYCMNVSTYLASAVILSVTVIILIRPSLVSTWPYLCCHHHGMSALADPAMVQRLAMLLLLSCPSYPSLLLSLPSTTTNCSTTQQHLHLLLNSSYYQFWAASGGLNFPSNPVVVLPRWCQTMGNLFYCFSEAALIYI